MAISRPLLLALLATVLAAATFLVVQNARTDGEETTPVVPVEQAAQPSPQPQPAADPRATLQAGLNLERIDSASFRTQLDFTQRGERASIEVSGAYERGAPRDIPEFAVNATLAADGRRARGGFTSLGDRAFFTRGDTGWRVPAPVWEPLVEAVASGQGLTLPVDPRRWVSEVSQEGTATLDGVETDHVRAVVDPKLVVRDITRAARANGARVPGGRAAARSVKSARLDAWVGANDDLMRRLTAEVAFTNGGRIALDVNLTGVNEPQEIAAPTDVRGGMPGGVLGDFATGLTAGITGVTGGEPTDLAALTSGKPRKAARAVKAGKKVVILFRNPRGLDDRTMERVMREVAASTRAVVLTDHVAAVERYGKLVEDLGVSQTPSVVLIDRAGQARLFEGYVDAATLTQAVSDSR